ncbi:signal recognition particle-docking protein FtsY, partial [Campylobacter sp. CH185]
MFDFFKKGLAKTLENIVGVKGENKKITKDLLEEILLEADVSYEIVEEIIYYLPPQNEVKKEDLKHVMGSYFLYEKKETNQEKPFVELILGVNGAGKTTSIAKLAYL